MASRGLQIEPAFVARKEDARGRLNLIAQEIARLVATIVSEAAALNKKVNGARAFSAAVTDIEQQLVRLFAAGFVVDTPPEQLPSTRAT